MKVCCVQFAPEYREPEKNIERIETLFRKADGDIVVFPELATTGYFFKTKKEIAPLAEEIPGPLTDKIARIARDACKAIVIGFLERLGDRFYNSSLAFDCKGRLAGHYRKVHLFYYETQIFSRGDVGFPVFPLETPAGIANVGMAICYDWRFPEPFRKLALAGAELIAMPSNIVTTTGMLHTTLQTRAFENKIVLAFADRIGNEINDGEPLRFRGESAIVDLNGAILAQASELNEEIISAEVDLEKTKHKRINQFNDLFSDRIAYGL